MNRNNLYQDTDNSYSQYSDEELYHLAEKYDDSCEEEKALPIFEALANKGNPKAQYMLGFYYNNELGGLEKDIDKALRWYEKSALQGNAEAMNALGDIYLDEDTNLYDTDKAIYWYDKAIERGWYEGYMSLAHCYKDGKGVDQNYQQAYELYMKALEMVDDEDRGFVYYNIGLMFYETEQYTESLYYLLKVDDINDHYLYLHFILGKCYFHGLGTDVNYQEAVKYFNRACKHGISEAYHYLGICYLKGYGVIKDEKFANECFRNVKIREELNNG